MGLYPAPPPFSPSDDVDATAWIDENLQAHKLSEDTRVGLFLPRGFEAYARVFHPARRDFGPSRERGVTLRWSEVAAARGKIVHPQMQVEALIDDLDAHDYDRWEAISVGGGVWFPPFETLEESECLALASVLAPFTQTPADSWFLLWDGYGDLGEDIEDVARAYIHPDRSGLPLPPELAGHTRALRHYLIFRGPLEGLSIWFSWRFESPNYWWPLDRAWVVATEVDGFSTYVGGSQACIEAILSSPHLEALPSSLEDRWGSTGDTINRAL